MELNNTSACVIETEEINELIDEVDQYLLILQGIIVSVIGIVGMVINIFAAMIILANKQLHSRPFILCLQIIFINIMYILLLYIPLVLTNLVQLWFFGSTICTIIAILTLFVSSWRWPVMFLMILDRQLTISFPFRYKKHANKIMTILSILLFFSSLVVTLVPLVSIGCYNFTQYSLICTISWHCTTVICYVYYLTSSVAVFIIGAAVPVFMYTAMYIKAQSLRKGFMSVANSLQSYRQSEQRARKTVLLLFTCLVCLTLPSWLFYVVTEGFSISPNTALLIVGRIVADIYYGLPIADAVVILRNRDIKSAIRKNMKDRGYNCCSRDTSQKGSVHKCNFLPVHMQQYFICSSCVF